VPPALVTGMGVAAAAVLALGLVWQLRPQYSGVVTQGEADAGEEVILIAPSDAPRAPMADPASQAERSRQDDAAAAQQRVRSAAMSAAEQASRASAKAVAAAPAPAISADEAPSPAAPAAMPVEEKRAADSVARDAAAESGFVGEPPAAAPATSYKSHATYTTAARATAERRERAANAAAVAPPAPVAAAAAPVAAEADAERQALDRIEVTGSRIKQNPDIDWSQVPVSDDAHLAVADWLERIRARRDDGDTDSARASLRLFQREYPRVRLPDDLRTLLADAKR
jgi:hypothetical protein